MFSIHFTIKSRKKWDGSYLTEEGLHFVAVALKHATLNPRGACMTRNRERERERERVYAQPIHMCPREQNTVDSTTLT